MHWFHIALKDLRILVRDRVALAISLLMPFTLMLILGAALAPAFTDTGGIPRFPVGFADADGGMLAGVLQEVFTSAQLKDLVELKSGSADELRTQVRQGKLAAAVLVPAGFSAAIIPGDGATDRPAPAQITVISDPGQVVRAGIVQAVVDGFTRQLSAATLGTGAALTELISTGAVAPQAAAALAAELGPRLAEPAAVSVGRENIAPRQGVSAAQYYAAGMAVMFLFFGASFGVRGFQDEENAHTLQRLLTTPAGPGAVVFGKLTATLLAVLAQLVVLVLATRWLLGVRWGAPLGVALLGAAAALAATGVVIFIAAVAPTPRAGDLGIQLVTQFSALLGGSMVPLYAFPDSVRWLSKLTVNGWALGGFLDLMGGRGPTAVLLPVLVLVGAGLLFGALGTWRIAARSL